MGYNGNILRMKSLPIKQLTGNSTLQFFCLSYWNNVINRSARAVNPHRNRFNQHDERVKLFPKATQDYFALTIVSLPLYQCIACG